MQVFIPNSPSPFGSRGFLLRPELPVRIDEGNIVWEKQTESFLCDLEGTVAFSLPRCSKRSRDWPGRDPNSFCGFARKYGPLGVCRHGFAMGHRTRNSTLGVTKRS